MVSRISEGRDESSSDFVFALCAGFERLDLVIDAVINALVVAGFKMLGVVFCSATPESTIKSALSYKHD